MSVLDVQDGKVRRELRIPATPFFGNTYSVAGGVIVASRNDLRFLSESLAEVHFDLFTGDALNTSIQVSPDGRTIIANRDHTQSSTVEQFDGSTFVMRRRLQLSSRLPAKWSVSSTVLMYNDNGKVYKTDLITGRTELVPGCGVPTFITEEEWVGICTQVVTHASNRSDRVLDTLEDTHEHDEQIATSRSGVFAVSFEKTKGGGWDTNVRSTTRRIVVYESQKGRHLLDVEIRPLPKEFYDFTLSPDGHWLAVLVDEVLSVYRVS